MARLLKCNCNHCGKLIFRCRCKKNDYHITVTVVESDEKKSMREMNT